MNNSVVVEQFRKSMTLDYDAWHDGIGYDVAVIESATPAEREAIAELVIPPKGWRDVQVLATLECDTARAALREAVNSGVPEVRVAITRFAPSTVTEDEKTALLVRALSQGAFYQDMTSALQQVEHFHPKPVVDAMFIGLFTQSGDVACHFAAMLTFLHKKAKTKFDWAHRPLFLRFNTESQAERRDAFTELCALLKIDEKETFAFIDDAIKQARPA